MSTAVFIVLDHDLGWDCIVGVFDSPEAAEACAEDRGNSCTTHLEIVEKFYQED